MSMLRSIFFFVVFLFATKMHGQYPELAVASIDESLLTNAHSVVRFDNRTISFEGGKLKYDIAYAITILNEKHSDLLTVALGYQEGSSKISELSIEYVDKDGKVVKKVKSKEIEDRYLHSNELLSGGRFKYFAYQTNTYPSTIIVRYKLVEKSRVFTSWWFAFPRFNTAVESTNFTIQNPDNADYQVVTKNLDTYGIKSRDDQLFSGNQLKAITKERYMPKFYEVVPTIELYTVKKVYHGRETNAQTWEALGNWMYHSMFVPQQNCNLGDLKVELDQIIGAETDKKRIAEKLYKFVQNETRYVAILLEDGGYVPLETEVVHTKKYGDCKALSYYYHTLLELYGIKSDLAFVLAGDLPKEFDESIVTPTRFNHVINRVWVDGKDHWVDCTSDHKPFGFVGTWSDDRQTLIANASQSGLGMTPKYEDEELRTMNLQLSEDGSITGSLMVRSIGSAIDGKLDQLSYYDEKQTGEYQEEVVFRKIKKADVSAYHYTFDTAALKFEEHYDFTANDVGEKLGSYLTLPLSQISMPIPRMKKDKHRVWDVDINRSKSYKTEHVITTPANMLAVVEDDFEIQGPYGSYTYRTVAEPQKVTVTRTFKINRGTYPAADYKTIKSFFDKIRNVEKRKITYNLKS